MCIYFEVCCKIIPMNWTGLKFHLFWTEIYTHSPLVNCLLALVYFLWAAWLVCTPPSYLPTYLLTIPLHCQQPAQLALQVTRLTFPPIMHGKWSWILPSPLPLHVYVKPPCIMHACFPLFCQNELNASENLHSDLKSFNLNKISIVVSKV